MLTFLTQCLVLSILFDLNALVYKLRPQTVKWLVGGFTETAWPR